MLQDPSLYILLGYNCLRFDQCPLHKEIQLAWIPSQKWETINPEPHQTDNLFSRWIRRRRRPALMRDGRSRSPPHPSSSGRRPSSASAWRHIGGGRFCLWQAERRDSRTNIVAWHSVTGHTDFSHYTTSVCDTLHIYHIVLTQPSVLWNVL